MKRYKLVRMASALAVAGMLMLSADSLYAFTITLDTVRNTLINVDDAAGRWQHGGGDVLRDGRVVGHYVTTRRVTLGGTDQQNTAAVTMTIFFLNSGSAPQNMTLQGAHSFNTGQYIGSVSAASEVLKGLIGAQFLGQSGANGTVSLTF